MFLRGSPSVVIMDSCHWLDIVVVEGEKSLEGWVDKGMCIHAYAIFIHVRYVE